MRTVDHWRCEMGLGPHPDPDSGAMVLDCRAGFHPMDGARPAAPLVSGQPAFRCAECGGVFHAFIGIGVDNGAKQFAEVRERMTAAIIAGFGIPPHLIGAP